MPVFPADIFYIRCSCRSASCVQPSAVLLLIGIIHMEFKFSAKQKVLGLSDCERLCARPSGEILDLAHRAGACSSSGSLTAPLGGAINMMILATGRSYGVEWSTIATWLPRLRNEALLKLAEEPSNWTFVGSREADKEFWPMVYGVSEANRRGVDRLLGCSSADVARQLRFHSESDVEFLSNSQVGLGGSGRAPRFAIDAHDFASRIRVVCKDPLFFAQATSCGAM